MPSSTIPSNLHQQQRSTLDIKLPQIKSQLQTGRTPQSSTEPTKGTDLTTLLASYLCPSSTTQLSLRSDAQRHQDGELGLFECKLIHVSLDVLRLTSAVLTPKLSKCHFVSLSLQKAIEIVQRAIDEDVKQNYQEAYKLYQNSLDYFMMAMKCKSTLRIICSRCVCVH